MQGLSLTYQIKEFYKIHFVNQLESVEKNTNIYKLIIDKLNHLIKKKKINNFKKVYSKQYYSNHYLIIYKYFYH